MTRSAVFIVVLLLWTPQQCWSELTITQVLIRDEIRRLGGDWEDDGTPQLVAFTGGEFKSDHIEVLAHLPSVIAVVVSDVSVDKESMGFIGQVTELRVLDITKCKLESGCFSPLSNCKKLSRLRLEDVTLTDEMIHDISLLSQVDALWISDVTVDTDNSLSELLSMKLKDFQIDTVHGASDETVSKLKRKIKSQSK